MLSRYNAVRLCFPLFICDTLSYTYMMRLVSSCPLCVSNHSRGSSHSKKSLGKECNLSNLPTPNSSVFLSSCI